jgi:transposase
MSERHSMRKVREVLRLKHDLGRSERQIALAVGIARSTVGEYLQRAEKAGLTWAIAQGLGDAEVEGRLFHQVGRNEPATRAPIDFTWVHMELRRAGVTRQLLWTEYQEHVAASGLGWRPYQYSQFCDLYEAYRAKLQPSMRQEHRAGEKAFLDFSGKRLRIFDEKTGDAIEVELFVMVLGASNYTYAEATRTQGLADFVGATVHGLEYFGAVPEMLVPDQLKSAVSKPDRIEPEINATYAEMAQHYTTAVVPARPRKPKDKSKVENGVLVAQRWILACLRNRRFFCLEELNAAIRELLEKLNTRPFQKLEGCRRTAFEKLDRPAMKPLPAYRYELGTWKLQVGVNIDYHVAYDDRVYSAPCTLINDKVDVRATATIVELWYDGRRITSHERSYGPKGTAVTKPEHRPQSHREWGDWPPERLVGWAHQAGPNTAEVVEAILGRRTHPATGRRACLGLMRMGERYGTSRLEAACRRAVAIGNPRYKSVEAILKTGLDHQPLREEVESKPVVHENIRGGAYFDREEGKESDSHDAIEARYLEEERLGIMKDSIDSGPREARVGRADGRREMASAAAFVEAAPASRGRSRETLPELLGRLSTVWTRRLPAQGRYRVGDERGGDDSQRDSCSMIMNAYLSVDNDEESMSIQEDSKGGDRMFDDRMSYDGWSDARRRGRGEVK